MTDNRKQRVAYLLALLAVLMWSTMGTAFTITLDYISVIQTLFCSSLVAFVVLLIPFSLKIGKQGFLSIRKESVFRSMLMGFLNPFLYYVVLFKAYNMLPAQEAVVLNYTWPVLLVVFSIPLLKQKISALSILAILISFAGIIVIAGKGSLAGFHFSNIPGVSLATGSAIVWALYWIANMKDTRSPLDKLVLNFFFGFVYTGIVFFVTGETWNSCWQGTVGSIYIGFFEMGITFLIWMTALEWSTTTARISNMIFLSPFLSLIFIHLILGEDITMSTVTGLIMIISGILIQQYLGHRMRKKVAG